MNFSAIEIIALVFVLAAFVKVLIILVSRNSWASFVKRLYNKPTALMFIELVLAGIVIYYLLQSLSIIQIMGGVVLGALLTGMTFAAYGKELMPSMLKLLKRDALRKAWLPILVWLSLVVWTVGVLFGFI
ncbi:MAG: hypothetical protein ABH811_00110 [archaeon]